MEESGGANAIRDRNPNLKACENFNFCSCCDELLLAVSPLCGHDFIATYIGCRPNRER